MKNFFSIVGMCILLVVLFVLIATPFVCIAMLAFGFSSLVLPTVPVWFHYLSAFVITLFFIQNIKHV